MYSAVCRLNRALDRENAAMGLEFQLLNSDIIPQDLFVRAHNLRKEMEVARDWLHELRNE